VQLAILIPVYNEAKLLKPALARLVAAPAPRAADAGNPGTAQPPRVMHRNIYLVDDGSTDGTTDQVRQAPAQFSTPNTRVHAITHPRNLGKGAAIATALAAALAEEQNSIFLIQDADLEYDPRDHEKLVMPILEAKADAVIGSRFYGETHRVLYFWHSVANKAITTFSNIATNLNLTDIECCLKAWTRPVATRLVLKEQRFGIEPEIIAKLAHMQLPSGRFNAQPTSTDPTSPGSTSPGLTSPGLTSPPRIYEVAVSYAGRTYAEGKKISWQDGFSALRCIVKYNIISPS
jgi:hypothetical protein